MSDDIQGFADLSDTEARRYVRMLADLELGPEQLFDVLANREYDQLGDWSVRTAQILCLKAIGSECLLDELEGVDESTFEDTLHLDIEIRPRDIPTDTETQTEFDRLSNMDFSVTRCRDCGKYALLDLDQVTCCPYCGQGVHVSVVTTEGYVEDHAADLLDRVDRLNPDRRNPWDRANETWIESDSDE